MNDSILIFGNGYIGSRLVKGLNCNVTSKQIGKYEDAQEELKKYQPDVIINSIGYIGEKNVDDCEDNKDKTLSSNTFVPAILAELAYRNDIKLIHISTGCIYHYGFKSQSPITEEESPDYFDLFYSRSKIYAERILTKLSKKTNILIVRPRVPLDVKPHPNNILTKLISFDKVIDVPNSVTYLPDFIEMLKHLISIDAKGVYNTVNKGALRYPELLIIYKKFNPDFDYETIDFDKLDITRTNLILSTEKLQATGFKVRDIHEVLEECVKKYLEQ